MTVTLCRFCKKPTTTKTIQRHFRACPQVPVLGPYQRICTRCQAIKPLDEFQSHCRNPLGRDFTCRECHRAAVKPYNLAVPRKTKRRWGNVPCRWCGGDIFRKDIRSHLVLCRSAAKPMAGEKFCALCQSPVTLSGFPNHQREPDGLGNVCSRCAAERSKDWWKTPEAKAKRRYAVAWNRYKLTPDQLDAMYESHEGRCGSCGDLPITRSNSSKTDDLVIDHDHALEKRTGEIRVRGLLCTWCNVAAGALEDSVNKCDRLKAFLIRTDLPPVTKSNVPL